jgi:hypothetical protein
MESPRLEDLLDDLYLLMNGQAKGILSNWHDVLFKVKVAKMGQVTLTDKDIETLYKAMVPLGACIYEVNKQVYARRTHNGTDNL